MGKLNCNVCGTIYPDTADKCPICGSSPSTAQTVEPSDKSVPIAEKKADKGGHFAKSNVRKRMKDSGQKITATAAASAPAGKKQKEEKEHASSVVLLILVLLALAISAYIVVEYVLPFLSARQGAEAAAPSTAATTAATAAPETTAATEPAVIPCTNLVLSETVLELPSVGKTAKINVSPIPENTTDVITFLSADPSVAEVDAAGMVRAIAVGETDILVICGDTAVSCSVVCTGEEEETEPTTTPEAPTDADAPAEFWLNREDVTFFVLGETFQLTAGDIDPASISWSSSDSTVASVSKSGMIKVMGRGYAEITAAYKGKSAVCIVRCDVYGSLAPENSSSGGNSGSDSPTDYILSHVDVTIVKGETFSLYLYDWDDNAMEVEWISEDPSIAGISENEVTGGMGGMTTVYCTYEGETYHCIVRVIG